MQHVFFLVLQQGAADAVNNALGNTGRAGRIHDVQGVIEWHLCELKLCASLGKILPQYCAVDSWQRYSIARKLNDHGVSDRVDQLDDAGDGIE